LATIISTTKPISNSSQFVLSDKTYMNICGISWLAPKTSAAIVVVVGVLDNVKSSVYGSPN
jgi:hypothetical protein